LCHINFEDVRLIVEWGAGSGAVTQSILERMTPSSRLVSFEANPNFYQQLKTISDPRLIILHEDVWNSKRVLGQLGISLVDCVVSTLPTSNIPGYEFLVRDVLRSILVPQGVFVQYTHVVTALKGFQLRPILSRYFEKVKKDLTLFNLPPAWIYTCKVRK